MSFRLPSRPYCIFSLALCVLCSGFQGSVIHTFTEFLGDISRDVFTVPLTS